MIRILRQIVRTGIVSENAPDAREEFRLDLRRAGAEVLPGTGSALAHDAGTHDLAEDADHQQSCPE